MEAVGSPPQSNLQAMENADGNFNNKEKEYSSINNENAANKEVVVVVVEGVNDDNNDDDDDDDKVVRQNNTNLELQKQKLILSNNIADGDNANANDHTDTTEIRCSPTVNIQESQINDDSNVENTCSILENSEEIAKLENNCSNEENIQIEGTNMLRTVEENADNNFRSTFSICDSKEITELENNCSKEETISEQNIQIEEGTNMLKEVENAESSFHTTFSETSFGTSDSDKQQQQFHSNDAEKSKEDLFPVKKTFLTVDEASAEAATTTTTTTTINNVENNLDIHSSPLDHSFDASDEAELQICSPKINGNHEETNDSINESQEQDENTIDELEKVKNNEENSIFAAEKIISKQENEIFIEKNKDEEEVAPPPVNIINSESRCYTPDSPCSTSSVHSSSSQQLVIDHPSLDEEKVAPLRLTFKRKAGKTNKKKHIRKGTSKPAPSNVSISISKEETVVPCINGSETETAKDESSEPTAEVEEIKYTDTEHVDAIPIPQEVSQQTENLITKSTTNLICDCNKTSLSSENAMKFHLPSCSSYQQPSAPNYYKCSSCGTFHENWNFFLHLREQHNRFLCLYCIKCFPTAEKLSMHLEIKHDLEQNHFNSEESFRRSAAVLNGYALETRFLMCCTCQHVFGERIAFTEHVCTEYMKSCVLCGQKGRHNNQCKAHPFVKRRNKKKVKEKQQSSSTLPTPTNSSSLANLQQEHASSTPPPPPPPPLPPPPQGPKIPLEPITHNEESNSSSNMVIDESCTINHSVNAFDTAAAAEKTESLSLEQPYDTRQQPSASPIPPPPSSSSSPPPQAAAAPPPPQPPMSLTLSEETNENPNKNFLKFKLRVPKEFQKPVDAVISSSESDDGANEEELADESHQSHQKNSNPNHQSDMTSEQLHRESESNQSAISANETLSSSNQPERDVDDEGCAEDDDSNPNLARILQEIEQTKLDIKRTKETIHHHHHGHSHANANAHAHAQKLDEIECEKNNFPEKNENKESIAGSPGRNWTPTPPASPKTSENAIKNENENANEMNIEAAKDVVQSSQENNINIMEETQQPNADGSNFENNSSNIEKLENNEPQGESMSIENNPNAEEDVNITSLDENKSDIQPLLPTCPTTTTTTTTTTVPPVPVPVPPSDGIEVANEDTLTIELQLDRPLDKYETVEFVRTCLKAAYPYCLYCNHARRIAVNGNSLTLHLIAQHRFSATVDSITAEELQPGTIVARLKSFLPELQNEYFNTNSYCTVGAGAFTRHFNERIFECFQCRFVTTTHKELYLHNRKMHLRTAILCFMCRCNFFSFSEILCHICPGQPHKASIFEIKFRCCLCDLDNIPSPFRLMVHLRKRHFACDICLEDCRDQSKLSSHVWKHKLQHLCYRCGIAYRNKMDITKHLFWKHGTESTLCKRCLNKRWPHVYHFCVPPPTFVCEVCQYCFTKAMYLTVHKRIHFGDFRYPCTEENCEEKFISRKLLLKHAISHSHQTKTESDTDKVDIKQNTIENENDNENDNENENTIACTANSDLLVKKDAKIEADDDDNEDKMICVEDKSKSEDHENQLYIKKESVLTTQQQNQDEEPIKDKKDETTDINAKSVKTPQKKKKKKRSKESLEDLNLTAPNLSESGSSSDSESETKSKYEDEVPSPAPVVPVVLPQPALSMDGMEKDDVVKEQKSNENEEVENPEKVLDIWKNFLQAQQASGSVEIEHDLENKIITEPQSPPPPPNHLHVCYSDHDYCKMFNPSKTSNSSKQQSPDSKNNKNHSKLKSAAERKRFISRNSNGNSSSSSDESSGETSSSSSCSCGSNCSCSAASSSSSSSSSSENSDSSTSASRRRRQRKKSERNNRRNRKSESISPRKNHRHLSVSEIVNITEPFENPTTGGLEGGTQDVQNSANNERQSEPNADLYINESDLETAESETDEEYYDEHPQKLANEILSKKRAQLMARTFLSPSHNFDIVENSRPSTPSLPPEDVVYEKRKKKKKRERKSTSKSSILPPKFKINQAFEGDTTILTSAGASAATTAANDIALDNTLNESLNASANTMESLVMPLQQQQQQQLQHHLSQFSATNTAHTTTPRFSEGSSCSDVDGSLKRSKRARRPNKFYGYTSDDESMAGSNVLGQSLLIGMRTYKPQPPPQLVWHKEDLPTPSKSILNNNNKKTPRAQKRPENNDLYTPDTDRSTTAHGSLPKKKKTGSSLLQALTGSSNRKRNKHLPPIPRLKIRPSLFGASNASKVFKSDGSQIGGERYADDSSDDVSSEYGHNQDWNSSIPQTENTHSELLQHQQANLASNQTAAPVPLPLPLPLPPTPQTTAFNHKIPPALLPNPDFATLQYFKANNIRYPIRPPAGARAAREGESVYCYCRCPYDEVSEMIACDGDNCLIEWFHFECVGIMVAPQGKWFCAECRPHYSEDLYPQSITSNLTGNIREH